METKSFLDKLKETYRASLGMILVLGYFLLILLLYFIPIPSGNEKIIYMAIGAAGGYVAGVVQFEFGSSRGSESKTAIMSDQSNSTTNTTDTSATQPKV